ncbi:hypothetical protein HQ38_05300 [Porphyromonas crevioricanis]|uniref:Uncharacterized protein n=1 Tax=Porphyromonas crevioricanis TaxID=393921 RepID=A0AB34PFE0_9PORP|nr:hypothetical protein HQ38_05300 [Porphyromonas crevioricanis]
MMFFVKWQLSLEQEKSKKWVSNIRPNTFFGEPPEIASQNALFIGILRGSKFSQERIFANTGENKIFLRREFSFSPVSRKNRTCGGRKGEKNEAIEISFQAEKR